MSGGDSDRDVKALTDPYVSVNDDTIFDLGGQVATLYKKKFFFFFFYNHMNPHSPSSTTGEAE